MAATIHVEPLRDLVEHDTSTDEPDCVCGPVAIPVDLSCGLTARAIVHYSLDGREFAEAD